MSISFGRVSFSISNGEIDDPFVLVTFDEVIDEIPIQDCLEKASYKGYPNDILPVVDPECYHGYQCKI